VTKVDPYPLKTKGNPKKYAAFEKYSGKNELQRHPFLLKIAPKKPLFDPKNSFIKTNGPQLFPGRHDGSRQNPDKALAQLPGDCRSRPLAQPSRVRLGDRASLLNLSTNVNECPCMTTSLNTVCYSKIL
jgi:hypothetical protein